MSSILKDIILDSLCLKKITLDEVTLDYIDCIVPDEFYGDWSKNRELYYSSLMQDIDHTYNSIMEQQSY
jgi:hypothetical protein